MKEAYIGIKLSKDLKETLENFVEKKNISLSQFARTSMFFFVEEGIIPEVFAVTRGLSEEATTQKVDISPLQKEIKLLSNKITNLTANIEISQKVKSADLLEIIDNAIEEVVDEVTEEAIKGGHGLEVVFDESFKRIRKNISEELSNKSFREYIMDRITEIIEKKWY